MKVRMMSSWHTLVSFVPTKQTEKPTAALRWPHPSRHNSQSPIRVTQQHRVHSTQSLELHPVGPCWDEEEQEIHNKEVLLICESHGGIKTSEGCSTSSGVPTVSQICRPSGVIWQNSCVAPHSLCQTGGAVSDPGRHSTTPSPPTNILVVLLPPAGLASVGNHAGRKRERAGCHRLPPEVRRGGKILVDGGVVLSEPSFSSGSSSHSKNRTQSWIVLSFIYSPERSSISTALCQTSKRVLHSENSDAGCCPEAAQTDSFIHDIPLKTNVTASPPARSARKVRKWPPHKAPFAGANGARHTAKLMRTNGALRRVKFWTRCVSRRRRSLV